MKKIKLIPMPDKMPDQYSSKRLRNGEVLSITATRSPKVMTLFMIYLLRRMMGKAAGKLGKRLLNLAMLLSCLMDRGMGRRNQFIFKNLNSKNFERILQQASTAILGAEATPIMPSAFLTALHILQNIRMPAAQRRAMQKGRQVLDSVAVRD